MKRIGCAAGLLLAAGWAAARIVYEAETRTVVVSDFPESLPARLDTLARADRANGWGLLDYAPDTQTWTLRANLQVGRNDGTETWMQIACPARPRETLALDGTLVLCPYLVVGENDRYTPKRVNRLTLGAPDRPDIRASLTIAGAGHTVLTGKLPGPGGALQNGFGGELRIHHGALTSPGGAREIARPYWSGELTLDHAVVSGFKALALFGTARHRTSLRDSIFENNDGVFGSPAQEAVGCLFRGNGTVIQSLNGDTVRLIGCRFQDNDRNWNLFNGGTIDCLDCAIAPGAQPDRYGFKQTVPARVFARRSTVVKVVAGPGAPAPGATVTFTPRPSGEDLVFYNHAVTGPDGCTPAAGTSNTVILTESVTEAVPEGAPRVTRFTYSLEVKLAGKEPVRLEGYAPRDGAPPVEVNVSAAGAR